MCDNNLSTLDRLMEFGMGMGLAQQMVNMMNQSMQTMQIPASSMPVQPKETEWFIAFSENEMKKMLLDKKITKDTLVWCAGMLEWQKIENTPSALKLLLQLPPAL